MESVKRILQKNPYENANPLSRLLFYWTRTFFIKGYSKTLDTDDICEPLNEDKSKLLGERLDKTWNDQLKGRTKRPSLIKAIVRAFWREYLVMSFITFINDVVVRLAQPILLGQLLLYFRKDSDMTHAEALKYAAGIVMMSIVNGLSINHYFMRGFYIGMKVRVAVCSLIYKKILRLSHTALGDTAPGKVVNLLSNDVNRFDIVSLVINSTWNSPLMTLIAGYLLWREAQWAGVVGISVVFLVVPIQVYAGKFSSKFRYQTALRTDERVRFMDEIVSGVQVIKMYAWERPFTYLITLARKMELNILLKYTYIRAIYMTFMLFTTRMAMFCTMLSIVLLYGRENLTVSKVFVISAFFGAISHSMSQTFVRGIAEISEALVAFRRLQQFMEYEEKIAISIMHLPNGLDGSLAKNQTIVEADNLTTRSVAISLNAVTARWAFLKNKEERKKKAKALKETVNETYADFSEEPTLQNLSIEFKKGKLIGIVGPVGAGKSSLLQVLLREMPLESGEINVYGSLSYCSQEPWVFAGSVRQNILFGQSMDRVRYDKVIKACALFKDLEQLKHGDETMIGERGTSLSGGQKARINLARAVYHNSSIYLMDDPLSAVDAHVGLHLFNDCIGPNSLLAQEQATRILVTHQVHFLKEADWIVILRDGQVELQGTHNDIVNSGVDFATLLATEEDVEIAQDHRGMRSRASRSNSRSSIKSHSTASSHSDEDAEDEEKEDFVAGPQELEASSKGKVKGSLFLQYLQSGAHSPVLLLLFCLFLTAQILASGADYFVAFWTHQEELRTYYSNINSSKLSLANSQITSAALVVRNETGSVSYPDLLRTETCAYIHGSIVLTLLAIAFIRTLMFFRLCINASQNLHDNMFKSIISTTMRFFDLNPSGRILNRFSKDMGSTDEYLPKAILDSVQLILIMLGAICVTVIVNPLFLIPLSVMGLVFIFLRKFYLKSSKDIKRLEGMAKSPVFTHISATLYGLSTIRALNAEKILVQEFDNHQDTHSACWFMFISMGSAFGLLLDMLCIIFIFCVVYVFLMFDTGITGDKVALAITQSLTLTGLLQWGVRQSAEIQNQLMSVERILEYSSLEPEKEPVKTVQLPEEWPSTGKLEFRNVFYKYFKEAEPVLRGLSFVIQPKEKIGIVGRTGAGKSSLIGAIFRLAEIEGEIIIDDVNTSLIKLNELRSKIAIIPQDPVLFSGTMRRNLDPFDEYTDADIWKSLEDVELKDICGPAGLQSGVMAHGSNFSVGQRQLLCLARAILRKNRILVLDEATANVDPHTDLLIQQTIREKFTDCTVLTVAHRLNTIIDSDRVLVMDAGKAIELDTPYKLMMDQKSVFAGMVTALGLQEFSRLLNTASDKHDKKNL